MFVGILKRFFLEVVCILILLIFVILRFYKEVCDVEDDEESYDWMNKFDVVFLIMFFFIIVVSLLYENSFVIIFSEKFVFIIFFNILLCVFIVVLIVVLVFCLGGRYMFVCREFLEDDLLIMFEILVGSRVSCSLISIVFEIIEKFVIFEIFVI